MDEQAEPKGGGGADGAPVRRTATTSWRTRLTIGVAAMVGLALGIGVGAAEWDSTPVSAATGPAGLARTEAPASTAGGNLYVVDGRTGSATRTGADSWRIDLSDASVLWFKDRPFRGSGTEPAAAFVARWGSTFAGSPPYGAVLAPSGPAGHHPTAVKLTDPAYDPTSATTSFTLTPDKGESEADAAWLSKLTPGAASSRGRVVLFIDNSSPGASGPLSPDDESIIEYFNQIEFSEDISVVAVDQGTQYNLQLTCPPQESPWTPPPDFLLTMYTGDSSGSATCNQGSIDIPEGTDAPSSFCTDNGTVCSFVIVLSNRATGTIYCQTQVMITLYPGINTSIIPNLNPATLPIPPETTPGSPGSFTSSAGKLDLCESSVSCTNPPTSTPTYSYNSNIYFQTGVAPG